MTYHVAATALMGALLLAGGCATAPDAATPKSAKAAPAPTVAPAAPAFTAPVMAQPTIKTEAPKETKSTVATADASFARPQLSAEATALIARLTQSSDGETLPHEVADTTSFPSAMNSLQLGAAPPKIERSPSSYAAPARGLTADGSSTALVERDWTGLVLVPIATSLSKAYTSDVRLNKVEAHPLNDGRVRVWTRVHNIGSSTLPAEIACEFRMKGSQISSPYFYQFDVPADDYRDVFFVSPDGQLSAYTVLVRASSAAR